MIKRIMGLALVSAFAFAGLTSVPSQAVAACPTAEDIKTKGVWITYEDDWATYTYQTKPDTYIEMTYYGDGSDGYWFETYLGIYLTAEANAQNGRIQKNDVRKYEYAVPLSGLPSPTKPAKWQGPIKTERADGKPAKPVTSTMSFGTEGSITIGDCTYKTIAIYGVWDDGTPDAGSFALQNLVDLGATLVTAVGVKGKPYDTFFKPVAIGTEKPAKVTVEIVRETP